MFTVKLHSNMHSLVPVGYSLLASTLVCAHTNKHAPAQTLKLMLVDTKKNSLGYRHCKPESQKT